MTTRIREPSGYWEWCSAVDDLAREDGVQATAHAWALHCVMWPLGGCRLRTPHVGVEELARRRGRDRTSIRRHLVALEHLGLLELVQRHGHGRKRLYIARVPTAYGAPGSDQPLPGLDEVDYRAAAHPLTGQQRPVLLPPRVLRTPPERQARITGHQRPVTRARRRRPNPRTKQPKC